MLQNRHLPRHRRIPLANALGQLLRWTSGRDRRSRTSPSIASRSMSREYRFSLETEVSSTDLDRAL